MSTQANLALVKRWTDYYNHDATRMVQECYAPDCKVLPMGLGVIEGQAKLQQVEDAVLAQAPRRYMEVVNTHAAGAVVCVEALLRDPDRGADWSVAFVAVLTIHDDRIVVDRTYADWSKWPGL